MTTATHPRAPGPGVPAEPDARALAAALAASLGHAVRGRPEAVRTALVAVLSGGHLLIEDVPGVGKTLLAKALARALGGTFRRVQGTADLLPSDVTGVSVLDQNRREWTFRPGPLFANVLLVDEINRATPRTQSALLEAMEERQVTVDGRTYPLAVPFVVVATQNPHGHAGTFPLVEGQLDRFAALLSMGHPPRAAERELLLGSGGAGALPDIAPVAPIETVAAALAAVGCVHCDPRVADYVLDVVEATRTHPDVALGASPRASLGLLAAARAHAVLSGRVHVTPGDVKATSVDALAHRLAPVSGQDRPAMRALVAGILGSLPVPV